MTAASSHTRPRDPLEAGLAHHRAGDIAKAEASYRRALAARPGDPVVLHLLGLATFDKGRPERALQLIDKALRHAPANPDFLHSAGHVLQAMGRYDAAVARYRAALDADPGRALTRSNLGNTLKRAGRFDEAAAELVRAVETAPDFAEGWSNLGLVEKVRGKYLEAVSCFERAAALRPEVAEFPYNLGNTLAAAGDRVAAAAALRHAIELAPAHVRAHVSLGAVLRRDGNLGEAQRVLDRALTLAPDDAEARWNLALAEIAAGAWKSGFADFEARLALPDYTLPAPRVPRWDGRPIPGRTLLVAHEQGMGDAIQFMRFAADAGRLGARVLYRGPRALLPLIARVNGVDAAVALDAPLPTCDLWLPMMSLPHVLKCTSNQRLSRGGYLAPDGARMARWRQRLDGIGGCRNRHLLAGQPGLHRRRRTLVSARSLRGAGAPARRHTGLAPEGRGRRAAGRLARGSAAGRPGP